MASQLLQLLRRTMPVTIRAKLLLFFGVSIVTMFVLMGGINYFGLPFGLYEGEYQKGKSAAIQRLNVIAADKNGDVINWFDHRLAGIKLFVDDSMRMASVRKLASSFRSGGGVSKPDAQFEEWLSSLMDAFQYDAIEILEPVTGTHLFSTEQDKTGINCSISRVLFAEGTEWTDKIFMGKGEHNNKGFLYIAHLDKVVTDGGELHSPPVVLLFKISMENPHLIGILHSSEFLGGTGEIVLIDMQKRLLATLKNNLPDGSVARVLDHKLSTRAAEFAAWGIDGTIESIDYRGVPVIAAVRHYRISPEFGLGIIVKQDEQEIFAPLKKRIYTSLVIISTGMIALLGTLYLVAAALLKPLETLNGVVYRLESGDLGARVTVETNDECGVLAKTFNQMAENIQKWHAGFESQVAVQTEEIRGLNADLEQRVIERTDQLKIAYQEMESFAYSVSHDLRAPLRSIDGFSLALLEDYGDKLDDGGKDYLRRVRSATQKMAQLIDDILKLSRITRCELALETVNLTELAGVIADELRSAEPERKVEFVITKGLKTQGDTRLLKVVLDNLLGNAWKFTGSHAEARIEFGSSNVDGKTAYFIRDDGAGFDPNYADKLFVTFQRLHTEQEFSGTGIGLSLVQHIIHRHGGAVWAQGAVEQGATFWFTVGG